MKILLFLFIGFFSLATPAWSLSYTCRDAKGTRHFADSPLRLPNTCEGTIWQFEQPTLLDDAPPATEPAPTPKPKNNLFKQMIKEESLARKFEQLEQQAADAVEKYEEGAKLLNIRNSRWHYGRKARRKNGQKLIHDAQQAKQDILNNIESLQLSPQQQTEIDTQLAPIK